MAPRWFPPLCTPKLKTSIPSQSPGPSRSRFFPWGSLLYHRDMAVRRRRRGFEGTGACAPDQLGLPKRKSRELRLAVAWREVAGEVLAGRAEAVRVNRGTLEVQVDERRWEETVRALLPRLAGRVARAHPGLGVRRCRLLVQEGDSVRRGEAVELEGDDARADRARPAPPTADEPEKAEPPTDGDVTQRLTRLGDRYLARSEGRRVRTRSARWRAEPSDPR